MAVLQKTFRNTVLLFISLFVLIFAKDAQAQCAFNDLEWEVEDCVNGAFYVTFSFNNPLPGEDGFAVWKDFPDGYFVSFFSHGESSYSIGPFEGDGSTFYQFTLYDYGTNNCEGLMSIGTVGCGTSEECTLFASAQQSDCFQAGGFQWMFFVNPINGGTDNGYTIYNDANEQVHFSDTYANNQNHAFVEAQSNGVGEMVNFTVVDNANPTCTQIVNAVDLGCSLCDINIFNYIITECTTEGEYYAEIFVEGSNSNSGQFTVGASFNPGVQWGPFAYGQESHTIGPVTYSGTDNFISVNDIDPEAWTCYDNQNIGEIDCENLCDLGVVEYEIQGGIFPCEESEFAVLAFFSGTNGNHLISIYADGEFLMTDNANFLTIWPVQGDGVNPVTLTFVSEFIDGCETSIIIQPEEYCNEPVPDLCAVEITSALITDCNADFEYFVDISVSETLNGTGQFTVFATYNQGTVWGPFDYGEEVYSIGPISSAANFSANRIYAVDSEQTNSSGCSDSYFFGFIECDNLCDLEIDNYNVNVDPEAPCGEFGALFHFSSDSSGDEVVDIYADGVYLLSDTPEDYVPIPSIQGDGVNPVTMTFVSDAIANCETSIIIQADEYCDGAQAPISCFLDITSVTPTECTNGEFFITLAITATDGVSEGFNLVLGDTYLDGLPYGQGNYTVGPISQNNTDIYHVAVFDPLDNDCGDSFVFEVECLPTSTCVLEPSNFAPINCTGNEVYFIASIETTEVGTEGFTLVLNEENYGTYPYEVINYEFGPFPYFPGEAYNFEFIDNEIGAACAGIYTFPAFEIENCTDYCFVNLDALEVSDCNADGEFYLEFEVSTTLNSPSTNFIATLGSTGEQFGPYDYGQGVYTVGPFPSDGSVNDFLIVEDNTGVVCGAHELLFSDPDCETSPECTIGISGVELSACDENGEFTIDFEVDVNNSIGSTFMVIIELEQYGPFEYGQISYSIGPLNVGETDEVNFGVYDSDNVDCNFGLSFTNPNCDTEPICMLEIPVYELYDCNDEGQYYLDFELTGMNPGDEFLAFGNGQEYGTFIFGETFYTVGPFEGNGDSYELIINDLTQDDCSTEITFVGQECDIAPPCEIEITFVENHECDEGAQFLVDFGVSGLEVGDQFFVFGNGEEYGVFIYEEGAFTVGPFTGDGGDYELIVSALGQDDCIVDALIMGQNCLDNFPCGFNDILTQYNGCSDDGVYFYTLDFIPVNTTNDFFDLNINGETSFHAYADLPIDIQIFPTNTGVFTICDNDNPDCCQEVVIDLPECETGMCNIEVTEYTLTDCDDIGNFYVNFSLGVANPNSSVFYAFHNGTNYGPFEFGQATYQIGPFDGLETAVFEIDILIENNADCFAQIVFESANCEGSEDCTLEISEFELIDCDPENQFYVQFAVVANNPDAATFVATGNGENYGTFNYEDGFYIVGPFDGNLDPVWELIVTDTENPDCSTFITFVSPDCNDELCNLEVADYFSTECDIDGQFYVEIYLTETSFGGTFQVFNDSESYGPFDYGSDVITVGPFDGWTGEGFNLELFDSSFDQCFDNIDIEGVECPISDCFITDLEVATGECNDENTYSVTINFVYDDIGGEFFNLIYQEEIIGTYETVNLPLTIENFAGNAEVESLTVCMTDLEDCCMTIDFLTPQCEGLITWPGDGNFDGITNNMDILNMGIAYGFTGPERMTDNVNWNAQNALAWENTFLSGINYVHADADGNGEVNMADSEVVGVNYDLTHDELTPFVNLEPNDASPALFVDMPDPFDLQQGMEFSAPIIFGLEDLPVDNVYGLAFTLRYDPEIIDPSSVSLEFPISWLGFPQTNLMTFEYHDIDAGEMDVTITKIDQNNVSGWGEILHFIGIIDNIAGKTEIFIEIDDVKAIRNNEERFPINTPTEITVITSTEDINDLRGFELFPNPTNDIVRIKNETGLSLQTIQISDLNGKLLRTVRGQDSFDLSRLPSGVYMAKVEFEGKTVYRKLVRM